MFWKASLIAWKDYATDYGELDIATSSNILFMLW